MIDKNVYPLSSRLEEFILMEIAQAEAEHPFASYETTSVMAKTILSNFLEYEHGTAEAEDLFDTFIPNIEKETALKMMLSVYQDVILSLIWGRF